MKSLFGIRTALFIHAKVRRRVPAVKRRRIVAHLERRRDRGERDERGAYAGGVDAVTRRELKPVKAVVT